VRLQPVASKGVFLRRRYSGDPFDTLGVSRGADPREIRAAYRRLAKQHHPDVNASPDAADQMARINWAYSVAMEHARHEGPRVYRGGSHRAGSRLTRTRWFVRQRPPPQGGRLIVETGSIVLHGQRGENANVEGIVLVRNGGTGPLEGEARANPAFVIVRPKQFTLGPQESQMFRVSVPNRYCADAQSQVAVDFESNGGDGRAVIGVPPAGDVLLVLEPHVVDLGQVAPGEQREARLRLTYRGEGLPPLSVAANASWLQVRPLSLPRRTAYYRLIVNAPDTPGTLHAEIVGRAGAATAIAHVQLEVSDGAAEAASAESRTGPSKE
jgi:hypothetical protein